jgi:hypothetical protein
MHRPSGRTMRPIPLLMMIAALAVAAGCKGPPERPILYPFDFGAGGLVDRQPPVQFGRPAPAPLPPGAEPRTLGDSARMKSEAPLP